MKYLATSPRATLTLLGILTALPVHAMTLPPGSGSVLHPGTRVRWSSSASGVHVGSVIALSSDTLSVTNERGAKLALAIPGISSLDISTPTNQAVRYAWMGGLVGAGICVGTVAIVDFAKVKGTTDVVDVESGDTGQASASTYVTAALIGVGLGAVIGGMMGARKPGPERWKPIEAVAGVSMLDNGIPAASVVIRF